MIKLKPILEKSVKSDFIKAISSHKPVVSYRVHADIGDDKVGITGWYTIAVIHDVIDDIKKTGVKILGIEKSTDLKKLHKNVDGIKINENKKILREEAEGLRALSVILFTLGGPVILWGIGKLIQATFNGVVKTATKVRNIVAPPKYIKFLQELQSNKNFIKQFVDKIKTKGGVDRFLRGGSYPDISDMLVSLPAFNKAYDKFCKEERIDKKTAEQLKKEISYSIAESMADNTDDVIKDLLKKNPELTKSIDLKEMLVSDRTDGRVKQMLKKMQSTYPSLNAINYETRDKTYLFAFGKKSDAEKLEKDFANVKSKKGKMKLIRTADYPNDKPPVFIKQYQIIEEAWLKQASPLIEKTETITRLKTIVNEISAEQNEEMVSGVAEILRGVEDIDNRKELAVQMMDKFDKEKVPFSKEDFLKMCDIEDSSISEADSPTERTRRYNRKNKKKVRAYLRKTQDDRVARNGDRAKAIEKHGKAKLDGKDVHHPNGPKNGNWRVVKGDHGPDKKD